MSDKHRDLVEYRPTATRSGAEADRLLAQAVEKYEAALRIEPNDHEVLNN